MPFPVPRPAVVPVAALLALAGFVAMVSISPAVEASPYRPRLRHLEFPAPDGVADVYADVIDVAFLVDPSLAANAGLFDDAAVVPSFDPGVRGKLSARLRNDMASLRQLPWDLFTVDQQIDMRWVYAWAETLDRQLTVERMYEHRPAQWLEPAANTLIALGTYAPDRTDLQARVMNGIPGMLDEMRAVCTRPTARGLETGVGLATALRGMARPWQKGTIAALDEWIREAKAATPVREYEVIGKENYAWRYEHALLFPFTPEQLLTRAEGALAENDARTLALSLEFSSPTGGMQAPPADSDAVIAAAAALTRESMLKLYDDISVANRAATLAGNWVSIPEGVGPIRTRETPDALVPLTGDGGSMNPPPTYVVDNTGWWNVQHYSSAFTEAERLAIVREAYGFFDNGMGPYSAHEGWPGHHLQLAIARLHPDPIRSILPDCPQNEGWALYAEEVFAAHGGLGRSESAQRAVLNSYRSRIRRVVYDVRIETGEWTLQQGADWKYTGAPRGTLDPDVLRSINWPTQLVCYFGGKAQIVDLREAARARAEAAGQRFDERAFHDAFLHEGSIPIALTRAKLLGEPVPPLPRP